MTPLPPLPEIPVWPVGFPIDSHIQSATEALDRIYARTEANELRESTRLKLWMAVRRSLDAARPILRGGMGAARRAGDRRLVRDMENGLDSLVRAALTLDASDGAAANV